jgi:hypothetical protein
MTEIGLARTIAKPLSDADIKEYLPNALVLKYSELATYPTIGSLLPSDKSFCILLYEDSPNRGHWTQVCKLDEDTYAYFDSYGGIVDSPLNWTPDSRRIALGEGTPLLSQLFNKCKERVVYNKMKYQKDGAEVNDCGRWCVLWTLKMKAGMNLDQFYTFVKEQQKTLGGGFDKVVATLIP